MARQFGYQDAHGTFYPDHPALRFEPGLVPGYFDTETKEFTPSGNPNRQTGTIVTDAGFGGAETLKSGLAEDKGADTAPLQGVAFTQTNEQAQSENTDLKRQLEEASRENAQWRAKDELARETGTAAADTSDQSGAEGMQNEPPSEGGEASDDNDDRPARRARRARK
ncbi:hypothetical protein [Paraburkholderia domus]|uniref:Uncharacterized protein n=1 Tax=Paraburkholderia domus TaxID=2793075 RepID=A0A9N8R4S2_9BURK|nr:hypothetical protein [Paraburkholderia domus]MBK5162764.1 hypothetical protein [Burkholderia sp. R-70211]CAE6958693.1 hypothetical protein R70211_06775 [Paraburkholderia domus]